MAKSSPQRKNAYPAPFLEPRAERGSTSDNQAGRGTDLGRGIA
eukprot:CAMPEP_0204369420 /NCGR_PEP_ID=MMETSP0469-20131031/44935_1 /ASSEMBLY_ACC=CAM_ASM_000384 /TAXON_ID=2969 /ORGANISM="Oxyrrhis marina" /LENGTH=42 /DNA_ID= /DNA_START= /DNA_END= /DNA_ORIENTATION=